jgi:hypothetical protein
MSPDERQVGVTLRRERAAAFPETIPRRQTAERWRSYVQPNAKPTRGHCADANGRRQYRTTADGRRTQKLNGISNQSRNAAVSRFEPDGLMDLIALVPYEKVKVLLQVAGKDCEEHDTRSPAAWSSNHG